MSEFILSIGLLTVGLVVVLLSIILRDLMIEVEEIKEDMEEK